MLLLGNDSQGLHTRPNRAKLSRMLGLRDGVAKATEALCFMASTKAPGAALGASVAHFQLTSGVVAAYKADFFIWIVVGIASLYVEISSLLFLDPRKAAQKNC